VREYMASYCVDCQSAMDGWYDCRVTSPFNGAVVSAHRLQLTGGASFEPKMRSEYLGAYGPGSSIELTNGRKLAQNEPPRPATVPSDAIWINDFGCSGLAHCESVDETHQHCSIYDDVQGDLRGGGDYEGRRPKNAEAMSRLIQRHATAATVVASSASDRDQPRTHRRPPLRLASPPGCRPLQAPRSSRPVLAR
jgi:hypothetical protein